MIIAIHEIDFAAQTTNIWFVDDSKCPGRLKKQIKDSLLKAEVVIQPDDSILYGQFDNVQEWTLIPPCKVDSLITWHIYE